MHLIRRLSCFGRGIDYAIVQDCIADGTIYESADYHNAVFIGKDESGFHKAKFPYFHQIVEGGEAAEAP